MVANMDFLKIIKKRSFLSEFIYVIMNVVLAVVLAVIVQATGSPWFAFIIFLLSMWRIFAVRPRFWFAHIKSNMVSIIIGISYVVFLYITYLTNIGNQQVYIIEGFLVLLYICWLLFLKPQSKRVYIAVQSGIALFAGITAIFNLTYNWAATPVVLLAWLVGYATASHILGSYDEENHTTLLSLVWGLTVAEISWLAYHWTIAYKLPIITGILLPQISVILICLGFLMYKSYNSYYHYQKIRFNDILLPLIFTISTVSLLVLVFNGIN